MLALAAGHLATLQFVDEVRIVDQGARHLQGHEARVEHLFHLFLRDHATHIDERHLQGRSKLLGVIQEIAFLERYGGNHQSACYGQPCLQPPEFLHVHIIAQGLERHGTTHHLHRGLADETRRKHQGMHAEAFQLLSHFDALFALHATTEAVVHVHLDHHGHIVARSMHHLLDDEAHETHPVLQRTTKLIVAAIGVRRQKLTNQVAMTGMDLDAVEACLTRQVDGLAEVFHQPVNLFFLQFPMKSRRIQVEATRGTHRHATTSGAVRHVAAVTQLDGSLGTVRMDGISEALQFGNNFLAHP